jgi:hypothetical protein
VTLLLLLCRIFEQLGTPQEDFQNFLTFRVALRSSLTMIGFIYGSRLRLLAHSMSSSWRTQFHRASFRVKPSRLYPKKKIRINEKVQSVYETSDLFDDNGSEIIGRDRRVVINKLNQYRSLFPNELSKFKVKKGATTQELNAYLDEMATIVETSSYDNFLTDSRLQAIKMVENGSKYTRHDITGCADMLKANP